MRWRPSARDLSPIPYPSILAHRTGGSVKLDGEVAGDGLAHGHSHGAGLGVVREVADLGAVHRHGQRGAGHAQEGDAGDAHAGVVAVVASGLEGLAVEVELDERGGGLLDADAVVEVQLAGGRAVVADGHDELEVLGAQLGSGHSAADALRHDDASAVVELDGFVVDVVDLDGGAIALHLGVREPVVEHVVGEVDRDGSGVLLGNWGDEDGRAEEVLHLEAEGVGVIRVNVEHRVDQGRSIHGLLIQRSVDVVQEAIADVNHLLGCSGHGFPSVELLSNRRRVAVVVTVEGAESTEGGPSRAQLLGGVIRIAADVGSYHGNLVDGGKGKHGSNGDLVMQPVTEIVS